jgi:hypothetical protein
MKEATYEEFEAALAKAKWPAPRRMHTRRTMTAIYSDRGTEVAEKTTIETRGKPTQVTYLVNPDYLK